MEDGEADWTGGNLRILLTYPSVDLAKKGEADSIEG
jgi:hypothetical protein